ncbi:DUF6069 family protein [Asanoa iriomotensis]|uniref:Secreted protein with PEP-CTERM sorting signal n=1 Tax=Asanoa iriomotensis TaxID=234613 RepID=A0ABQ4CF42_9ACTN|nr:DUF6069 family protein [Asanoa iriomotensis]GIF61388.1 hypothetical protein Air01nite_74830 [Asanoa iriomotensis]
MTTTTATGTDWRAVRRYRLAAIFGTVAANIVVWAIAVPVLGADLSVRTGDRTTEVSPTAVSVVTLLAGLLGWTLLGLLRRTRRPGRTWTVIACVVLLISLLGPLSAVTAGGVATLLTMHLVAGAGLIPALARTARR